MPHPKGRSPFAQLAADLARNQRDALLERGPRVLELHPRTATQQVLHAGTGVKISAVTETAAALERAGIRPRVDYVRDERGGIIGLGLWVDATALSGGHHA